MFPPGLLLLLLAGGLQAEDADAAPYESALAAAVHHFAREGDLVHLGAILDKHPKLTDAIEPLRAGRKPSSSDGYTPLDWAARSGHAAVVCDLIRRGAEVNAADGGGWTPLHLAAREGHLDVVKLLVKHGADVTLRTHTVAESSVVQPGAPAADPTSPAEHAKKYPAVPGRTPLEWAVAMNRAKVVEYFRSLNK